MKLNLCLAIVWFLFVLFPQAIKFDYSTLKDENFTVIDLLRGKGKVGKTWLFFGNYTPKIENYYMGFAYFCCILFTLYFSLFWLISSIMMAMQEDGGRMVFDSNNFTYLTFTSWDYSLKNTEATDILCLGIANSFRDLISDAELKKMLNVMRAINKSKLYIRRAIVWALTCLIIALACFIIWTVMSKDMLALFHSWGYTSSTRKNLLVSFAPSLVLGIVNILFPFTINKLPYFEYYVEPQTEVYISISRVFSLTSANTICLMLSLSIKMSRETVAGCGGSFIGQELYRILLVDTLLAVIGCLFAYGVYYFLCHHDKREFFLPTAVLRVINTQTLVWFGTLACPLMPVIGFLNMAIVFAIYYKAIEKWCKPTSKRWLQPHRNVFFLMIAVLSLLILTITFIITNATSGRFYFAQRFVPENTTVSTASNLSQNSTNQTCGPFDVTVDISPFQDILDATKIEAPNFRYALSILFSPIFGITIVVILSSALYVIVHRLRWEVERRLILLAEVHLERYEGNKLHHHKPKVHPGVLSPSPGSPPRPSPTTPPGSPPLRFQSRHTQAAVRPSQFIHSPPGRPPPGSPPPENPPLKR